MHSAIHIIILVRWFNSWWISTYLLTHASLLHISNIVVFHRQKLIKHIWSQGWGMSGDAAPSQLIYAAIVSCISTWDNALAPSQLIPGASSAFVLDIRCISFNYWLIDIDAFQVLVLVQELQQSRHNDGLICIILIPIKCNESAKNIAACTLIHTWRLARNDWQYCTRKMATSISLQMEKYKWKQWIKHSPRYDHAEV